MVELVELISASGSPAVVVLKSSTFAAVLEATALGSVLTNWITLVTLLTVEVESASGGYSMGGAAPLEA